MIRFCSLFFLLLFIFPCFSQKVNIDSLIDISNDVNQKDTNRLNSYKSISAKFLNSDPDSAYYFAAKQYELAQTTKQKKYEAQALLTMGKVHHHKGEDLKAIDLESKSLKIYEQINNKKGMSVTLCNMGNVFLQMGDFSSAVIHYTKSLKIAEDTKDTSMIIANTGNIGIIYSSQKDYKKAMEFSTQHLLMAKAINDKYIMTFSYRYIGKVYEGMGELKNAIKSYSLALRLSEEVGDENAILYCLNYIGSAYMNKKEFSKALEYFDRSLKIAEETKDRYGIAENLDQIGNCYFDSGDREKGLKYCNRALEITTEAGLAPIRRQAALSLFYMYKKTGKFQEALAMHELFMMMRDSINNEATHNEVMKQEMQHLYEKQKALNEKEHEKEMAIAFEQKKKQRIIIYATVGGLLMVLFCSMIVLNRLRITKRQKKIIELQKHVVEEKQKEIVDSITYAKRLQEAIFPSPDFVTRFLPESFILYEPKDIVAGDFYWMESFAKASDSEGDVVLIAAADCTGHGVPGAMVSVVCSNALNRAVKEFRITEPGKILDKVRELVIETFQKSSEDVKDGMDISLLSVEFPSVGQAGVRLQWAGANNPLWYIQDNVLNEITALKQPIGKIDIPTAFPTHTLSLSKGDTLFLFTDGYADQFGGPKGKKFKYRQLQELLVQNSQLPLSAQKEKLKKAFTDWKGNLEQIDDVCIIGIRL